MYQKNLGYDLRPIANHYSSKLQKIKLCLFDIDGIMTDGRIYFAGSELQFNRFFHMQDGYGLKILEQMQIQVGLISGKDSVGTRERFKPFDINHLYLGNDDKRSAYLEIKKKENLQDDEILFMGDDFIDLPLLNRVGFSATVPTSSIEIKEAADYITNRHSGHGAVREVIDILRHAHNFIPSVPQF
ncbi:MAG: KdsC family phosphatase [Bacteriovoracia bacterium]